MLFFALKTVHTIFIPIFNAEHLMFPYAIHPFDICDLYPETWLIIKKLYLVFFIISFTIVFFYLFKLISMFSCEKPLTFCTLKVHKNKKSKINKYRKSFFRKDEKSLNHDNVLELSIGINEKGEEVKISEKGLFQNILITGTIGTGKTTSAMYPLTEQIIKYNSDNALKKIGLLVLDVKGNYANQVETLAKKYNRQKDLIIINLSGKIKYNPLDKPNLKASVLANRLRTILELFSNENHESYWLDKAEQTLTEAIKFCRLYNNKYVTFSEIYKIIFLQDYFEKQILNIKDLFKNSFFNDEEMFNLLSCIDYFEKEFFALDERTKAIIKSEISIITNIFISDYNVSKCFCPNKDEINFKGFKEMLESGKIVVLQMNIAEYRNLSKIIATYLKLDFQTEVMNQLSSNNNPRISAFISDEYHEYISEIDSKFFAECREAKCINILATQSYTSLLNSIKSEKSIKVILQNLINKLWYRTDDIFTIEEAQKQIGKVDKEKESLTISENAKNTNYNMVTNALISRDSSISESYNKYKQKEFIFDTNFFSRDLKTFECLAFLSDGSKILEPQKLQMKPYFIKKEEEV